MKEPVRVLVLAEAVDLDRTSEGICTLKFLRMLHNAGCIVRCRYGGVDPGELPFDIGCSVERMSYSWIGLWNIVAITLQAFGRAGTVVNRLIQRWSGFSPKFHHEVLWWERTARAEIRDFAPDLVVTRGRGSSFRTHAALLRLSVRPPWVANYHDPWPLAHYPAPYNSEEPGSDRQVDHLQQIIRTADWLTFPSQRLREWFVRYDPEVEHKSSLIPHVETPAVLQETHAEQSCTPTAGLWTLVHVGTLLGPRTPAFLINAFIQLCAENPDFRTHARLKFIGQVQTAIPDIPDAYADAIEIHNRRVSYLESLEIMRSASALVVVEAVTTDSPFLPAKITDYLAAHKPLLLLTPASSELTRLFGQDYPYVVENGNQSGVRMCIKKLHESFLASEPEHPTLDAVRHYCSESAVGAEFMSLASQLLSGGYHHPHSI